MAKPKIILLGASGFIGKRLLNLFLQENLLEVKGYSSQECNLLFPEEIQEKLSLIGSEDIIIFVSSITRLKENSFDSMVKNIQMANNLAEFIDKYPPRQLIFLSTIDVYGLLSPGKIISEKLIPNPNDYYSLSKLSGELILKKICTKKKVPLLIMRLSGIYGLGDQGKSTINRLVDSALNGAVTIYGDGTDKRDFVLVDDLYHLIRKTIQNKTNQTLNVATGKSYPVSQIIELIREILHKDFVVEQKNWVQSEDRIKELVFDISLLNQTFPDFEFTDLKKGLQLYIKSYLNTSQKEDCQRFKQ